MNIYFDEARRIADELSQSLFRQTQHGPVVDYGEQELFKMQEEQRINKLANDFLKMELEKKKKTMNLIEAIEKFDENKHKGIKSDKHSGIFDSDKIHRIMNNRLEYLISYKMLAASYELVPKYREVTIVKAFELLEDKIVGHIISPSGCEYNYPIVSCFNKETILGTWRVPV